MQAKDSMRLSGVARSCPVLASRISAGGTASAGLIQEFSAQMHAVCKIALHRQSNLAKFLDRNGIRVVPAVRSMTDCFEAFPFNLYCATHVTHEQLALVEDL